MNVGEGAGLSGMKLGGPPLGDGLPPVPVRGGEGDDLATGEQADRQSINPSQSSATWREIRVDIGRLGRARWAAGDGTQPARQASGTLGGSTGVGSWSENSAASARPSAAVAMRSRPVRFATKQARSAARSTCAAPWPSVG